jgi:ribosomal protein S18 acetylase RimI-like enzyme
MSMEDERENFEKKIVVVSAKPEDARGIAEVFYKTWLDTYPNEEAGITVDDIEDRYKDSFTEESLKKRAERIANPPKGENLIIAKEDGKVVGLCRAIQNPDNNQIQAIYVLPEYQGRGIGHLLWGEAQKLFAPGKDIVVRVATFNAKAIDFYRKLGFEDTGKRWEDERFKMKSGAVIVETEMVIKKQGT